MNETDRAPLAAQLNALGAALQREQPPAAVLEGIRTRLRARRRPVARWGWAAVGAGCMAALAGIAILLVAPTQGDATVDALAGFMPLAAGERWRDVAQGDAWIVATELPQARLAAFGLPYDPTSAGDSVRAQLLMHSSGDVLAVRVVR